MQQNNRGKPHLQKNTPCPNHKNPDFARSVAKWVQGLDRAVTAREVASEFSMEIWQARKLLHYMMRVPGISGCLDWGYPHNISDADSFRPTRLFSIVKGSVVSDGK